MSTFQVEIFGKSNQRNSLIFHISFKCTGDKDPEHDVFKESVMEHLMEVITNIILIYSILLLFYHFQIVPAGGSIREAVKFDTGLVIRSQDFNTRVRVDFTANNATDAEAVHPYSISFYNLAIGDRGGDKPVELQHSGSGYIWIDGGHVITHVTDRDHPFTIRNTNKDVVFTVTLFEENDEL